jgi:hypothetical protein
MGPGPQIGACRASPATVAGYGVSVRQRCVRDAPAAWRKPDGDGRRAAPAARDLTRAVLLAVAYSPDA